MKESLSQIADNLVLQTKKLLKSAKTEEDLKIGFEKILDPILKDLKIQPVPKYERSIYKAGRADALHGQVVIEYEKPFAFGSKRSIEHAFIQLVNYIQGLSQSEKEELFIFEVKFIGVGFDGEQIFFVKYKGEKAKAKIKLDKEDFFLSGPYEFNSQSAYTLLTHLRALARLPLTADNLALKFGPKSELAPKAVSAFADALENWGDQTKIRTYFEEWKRLFGIVYGEKFSSEQEKQAKNLAKLYRVGRDTDFQELLFSIHTYFAFLMKLITAEILILKETTLSSSWSADLAHSSEEELKHKLEDIENGGIYTRRGISNFLEGDFFRWYLDAWNPRLKDAIQEIARTLSEFEPATSILAPSATRDLLKKLYQYLVPREIRHQLGEYYTPDWLAELLLNEVGYNGNTRKRLLDPACGSGTFIVLAIQRAREFGEKEKLPPAEIAKQIINNIWGFDLNPLAVISARTNYLFAMGDLVEHLSNFEIPIYMADSILWPEHIGKQGELNYYGGEYIKVKTSAKEFHVPRIWIKNKGFLMKDASQLIEKLVKSEIEPEIALKHFKKEGLAFPPHEKIIENFYKEILELEKEHKNGIWARFLKNAFAPMVAGKFDFVVGNPPWVRWNYLSYDYRKATSRLWENYGLSKIKESKDKLSSGKLDFSMLFTYTSSDYYLKNGGKLGFLITQEVFKSKGAGEGFRCFKLGEKGKYLKVLKAHDFVTVQPFEGAANKSSAIILQKGKKTKYPVPYFVWKKKKGIGKIPTNKPLSEIKPLLQKVRLYAKPIGTISSSWQTLSLEMGKYFDYLKGENFYHAKIGARLEPYGIFWLKLEQVLSDRNLLVSNMPEKGKKEFMKINVKIEPDLIYPSLRGADISRWECKFCIFIILTHNPKQPTKAFPENVMKQKYPMTYSYLLRFKEALLDRAAYIKFHSKAKHPFYSQFNISQDTFKRYKIVWKRMTNDIYACVITQYKTPFGYKMIIPMDTTSFIGVEQFDEAHYLCAIINSNPVRDFIKSFSSAGRGFGAPSVMEHIAIPKFDPKNKLHQKLAEISKKCHQLKAENKDKGITKLEKQLDGLVKKLFGIPS